MSKINSKATKPKTGFAHFGVLDVGVSGILVKYILVPDEVFIWDIFVFGHFALAPHIFKIGKNLQLVMAFYLVGWNVVAEWKNV
jgi:hypothetical protein